ncbi:zinc ribbon domain-containing protein [Paenibacillus sp. NPDC058071]|uniref:zinc ribbon domain-containing protein n=1 Tax=Paenibacillus sp. NPDC058071 TaxID=3346326 RepID=UPI0036DA78E6
MRTKAGNSKRTYDYRKEDEWLMVPIPSIVKPAVFELARKQRELNQTRPGNNQYKCLLTGKIKCSICGRKWNATTYSGRQGVKYTCYRCPNHAPKRYGPEVKRCPAKTIRGDLLDNYVWNLVMEFLSTPEDYIEQLKETSELVYGELGSALAVVEKDIKDKAAELDLVKTLCKHGVITEEEMLAEYQKLMKIMKGRNENLKSYNNQLQVSKQEQITSQAITELTEKVQEFIEQNGQQLDYKEKRFIIDSLIDEIMIRYVEDEVLLTVVGHLGALQNSLDQKGVILQRRLK